MCGVVVVEEADRSCPRQYSLSEKCHDLSGKKVGRGVDADAVATCSHVYCCNIVRLHDILYVPHLCRSLMSWNALKGK